MSTILDALKKSEQERKLTDIPTLSEMPAPYEPSRWPLILGTAVVVLLLIGLSYFLYRWLSVPASEKTEITDVLPVTNETIAEAKVNNGDNDIVVNVVSFSAEAEQRFVMINGKLYREGEFVQPGLRVEEIQENSVVLNRRGRRIIRKP